ncbi:hypothetical protein VXQ18_01455 [Brucella abortus]|nr:hypothetical protein [Brucella abortus]
MAGLDPEVRKATDALDAVGNATQKKKKKRPSPKGYAIRFGRSPTRWLLSHSSTIWPILPPMGDICILPIWGLCHRSQPLCGFARLICMA